MLRRTRSTIERRRQLVLMVYASLAVLTASWHRTAWAEMHSGLTAYVHGDYATAARLLEPAAERGDVDAQLLLGRIFDLGLGGREDDQEAVRWYLRAAEGGDAYAQLSVGLMYAEGLGVSWDFSEAFLWLSLAMVGLPPGEDREEAVEFRNLVRSLLTSEQARGVEYRLTLLSPHPHAGGEDGQPHR